MSNSKKKKRRARPNSKKTKSTKWEGALEFLQVLLAGTPLALYVLFINVIYPTPNSGFIIMGMIGSLFFGIGLSTISDLLNGTYIGSICTIVPCGIGAALLTVSSVIMYVPSIYAIFQGEYSIYYFVVWLFLLILAIWYVLFRLAIKQFVRSKGVSNTNFKKSMIGIKNYWWYETLNRSCSLKGGYALNKIFTTLYLIVTALHLLSGWWRTASIVISFLLMLCCLVCTAMWGWIICFSASPNAKKLRYTRTASVWCMLFSLAMAYSIARYTFMMWCGY